MIKKFFGFVFEIFKIVVISLVIIIPIRYFLIQPFYVKGASMEPSFYDYEYLIINELDYRLNDPERGEVVVFRYPRHPQEYFIKRIIGLPGEAIEIRAGEVYLYNEEYLQGLRLQEDYLSVNTKTYSLNEERVNLGVDEYFVLGDNRTASKDSRSFGAVNRSFMVGKVWLRGWPVERWDVFNELPSY